MKAEIKNLKKAAERILAALQNKEKVVLYGDADPDGVASVIILQETLEELGLKPSCVYFPNREKEGYGIHKPALEKLEKYAPALFLVLDCGVGNVEEVELAKKMGFDVLIIDHHKMLPQVPKIPIICNPKQKDDKYPFKDLATGGIIYKLSRLLYSLSGKQYQADKFLELAALATLADLMPLKDDNEKLVKEGILALRFTKRPGLKALIEINKVRDYDIREIRQKIVSPLNAGETKDSLNETYLLLIEKDLEKARKIAKDLIEKLNLRKKEIRRITEEVEKRLDLSQKIIFEGDENWHLVFLGAVASRICNKYKKPVFLFRQGKKESPGAVRMPEGLDAVKAMVSCSQLLKTYGGHPPAAGFRLKNENIEKFKECLINYFSRNS
jgi:single-stranded-DNA-specific exonuclease